jgi:hypothetical protein
VAALVLSANPALTWQQVRELLKQTADRVDPAGGAYDVRGHSALYGYGRVNAERAVQAALPAHGAAPRAATAGRRPVQPEVTFQVATAAPAFRLRLDDRPLALAQGRARARLEAGRTYVLSWWLEGEPGTSYRIEIDPGEFQVKGSFPIARRLAQRQTKAGGAASFELSAV